MKSPSRQAIVSKFEYASKKLSALNMSMRIKLFLFLVVLVLTMILGVIAVLLATGKFTAGLLESETLLTKELNHVYQGMSKNLGQLSAQAVEFSRSLSRGIEHELNKLSIAPAELAAHPEYLERITDSQFDNAYFYLLTSKCSGVFFILDATINPLLDFAQSSKAGLYIKNMEPNIISSSSPTIVTLRGYPSVSRERGFALHTQWKMEFDISDAAYYHIPFQAALEHRDKSLSQLYYWTPAFLLPGTSEEVILISVPLVDSNGDVFGVCGFEVSSMLFKLSYMPDTSIFRRIFCTLSPYHGKYLDMSNSLFAGGYSARTYSSGSPRLELADMSGGLWVYEQQDDKIYLGKHKEIRLYPDNSVFAADKWATAVLVPREDMVGHISRLNTTLYFGLVMLVIAGMVVSYALSRKFIQPISVGIDAIKSDDFDSVPKTRIIEIDDLIAYLMSRRKELARSGGVQDSSIVMLDEFLENINKLSPAERNVFNLYAKGLNAKEIADILYLSINTIKTHSKRIYAKLNVTSREELILYVNMLKELGKDINHL
ncbi:MAG TPA: LuxR C-terminal-related transcriptional regulator [Candidatus Atribacteria bacterium]|nr:LuxR C-terminal-related transcriptional regulator [Candidatus Atribacteria bacterium]